MYLKVKSKKLKNLSMKILKAKNNLVVTILNKKDMNVIIHKRVK